MSARTERIERTERVIDAVIRRESRRFTNRPADRGGPTKFGITGATLRAWRRKTGGFVPKRGAATSEAVRALQEPEARAIYRDRYVARPGFDRIKDDDLFALAVDTGVLHGPWRAVKWLQRGLGTVEDGIVGPKTLRAAGRRPRDARKAIIAARFASYGRTVNRDPSQLTFINGWIARTNEFLAAL